MKLNVLTLVAGAVAFRSIAELISYMDATKPGERPDVVDLAGEDSFPASDPPPWTAGRDSVAEV